MTGERLVKIAKGLLFIVGLWTLHLNKNTIGAKIYRGYSITTKILYCIHLMTLCIQFAILLKEMDNLERIIGSLAILIIVMENCTKCIIFQKNKIPYMFVDVIKNEREILESDEADIKAKYLKQVTFSRIINTVQLVAILSAISNFAVITFVEYYKNDKSAFKNKAYLHDNWYPFVKENHMIFVTIIQMYYLIIGGSINVATLTTFAVLVVYTSTKLKILQMRIKNIGKQEQDDLVKYVKNLIKEHQYIISFAHLLNERTKYVMLMDFVLNSLNIATAVMQGFITATTMRGVIYAFSIFFLVILQVFVFAWVANDVRLQSMAVADAVFESNWYEQTKEIKTLLCIMLMRAQTPLQLTIGPFSPMTNETALKMVKAAYTYLTLMMNSYKYRT